MVRDKKNDKRSYVPLGSLLVEKLKKKKKEKLHGH